MAEEEEEANWLDLPDHLLELIIDKLNINFFYYIRFGAVCVSWRSVFLDHAPKQFPPLLLIPTPTESPTESRSFYSISDNKVCDYQVRMPDYRQCRGSGPGSWLITVDDLKTSYSIRLFNPFLSHEILLPSLETFPRYPVNTSFHNYTYLQKAVLSADPLSNPDDFTVLAIFSNIGWLAYYKSGDKAWTQIRMLAFRNPEDNAWTSIKFPYGFHDIIIYKDDTIHKGNFLAIRNDGEVVVCQPEHRVSRRIALGPEKKENEIEPQKYLVHTSNNNVVILVHRCFEVDHEPDDETYSSWTTGFKVYKLILVNQWKPALNKWEPVKSLGDHALFIGANNCISICTSDYPGGLIKPNCIYYLYMEDPYHSPNDMGVYNLEDGSFEKHYHLPGISSIYPEPIWIQNQLAKLTEEATTAVKAINKQQTN